MARAEQEEQENILFLKILMVVTLYKQHKGQFSHPIAISLNSMSGVN